MAHNPYRARMEKRAKRTPGDLQALRKRLWAVVLSSYDDIVNEVDPAVRVKHYYAFTAIVQSYAKLLEIGEHEARLSALEEKVYALVKTRSAP